MNPGRRHRRIVDGTTGLGAPWVGRVGDRDAADYNLGAGAIPPRADGVLLSSAGLGLRG